MEITNTIFEPLLKKNNFKKKEFADYSKFLMTLLLDGRKKNMFHLMPWLY